MKDKLKKLIEDEFNRKILDEVAKLTKLRIHRHGYDKFLLIFVIVSALSVTSFFAFNYTGFLTLSEENITPNVSSDILNLGINQSQDNTSRNHIFNGNFSLPRENSAIPSGWFIKNSIAVSERDDFEWSEFYTNERYKKPLTEGSGFVDFYSLLLPEEFLYKDAYILSKSFSITPTGFYNFTFYYMPELDCYSITVSIVYFSNETLGDVDELTINEFGEFSVSDVSMNVNVSEVNDWYKIEWYPLTSRKDWGNLATIQIRGCGFVDEFNFNPA